MGEIKVLCIGDVVGQSGVSTIAFSLKTFIEKNSIDFTVLNGENATSGYGLSSADFTTLINSGVDCITSGNHIWQEKSILPILESDEKMLRPINYPYPNTGKGKTILEKNGIRYGVINAIGRENLVNVDCPFKSVKKACEDLSKKADIILIDFHAESIREKQALSFYVDGLSTGFVGTHTHTQTMDEKILPKGTAYISDLGFTGAFPSVIGGSIEESIHKATTRIGKKIMPSTNENRVMCGVIITIDKESKKAVKIERVKEIYH